MCKQCTAKKNLKYGRLFGYLINSINYIDFFSVFITLAGFQMNELICLFFLHFCPSLFLSSFFLFLVCFLAVFFFSLSWLFNASFIHVVQYSFSLRLKIHIKSINFTACFYGLKDNNITLLFLHSFCLNDYTEDLKTYVAALWKSRF